MSLKNAFIQHLQVQYPGLKTQPLENLISENLLCPFEVKLPSSILKQGQDFIAACFELREKEIYQNFLSEKAQKRVF